MRLLTAIFVVSLIAAGGGTLLAQDGSPAPVLQSELQEQQALLERVIANQKKNDLAQFTYERLERQEIQKSTAGSQPPEGKITRAVPAGTGVDRIPVGPNRKPVDAAAYPAELAKLERSLAWAAAEGRGPRTTGQQNAQIPTR